MHFVRKRTSAIADFSLLVRGTILAGVRPSWQNIKSYLSIGPAGSPTKQARSNNKAPATAAISE
jgi:hypothetical protein